MAAMTDRKPFEVPSDAPVVLHRHGEGSRRRSIVVVLDEVDESEAAAFLAYWRRRIGGWVSQADAAKQLGVGVKRVHQLRREGRLSWRRIGGVVAIDAASLAAELQQRQQASGE